MAFSEKPSWPRWLKQRALRGVNRGREERTCLCPEQLERYPYTPGSHGAPKRGVRRGRTGAVGATAHTKGQRRPAAGSRGMGRRGGRPAHTKPDFAPTGPRPPSPVHCSPFSTSALVTFNPWGPAVTLIPVPRGKKSSAPQRFYVLASCRDRCPPTWPPRRTVSPRPPPSASQSALDQPRPPRKGDPLLTSVSLAAMSSAGAWGRHPIRPSPSASLGPWPTGGDQWVCAELLAWVVPALPQSAEVLRVCNSQTRRPKSKGWHGRPRPHGGGRCARGDVFQGKGECGLPGK